LKEALQSAINSLTEEDEVGVWNWDENHYLGNIKMFSLSWSKLLRAVYKKIGDGSPARGYTLTGLYDNQKELRDPYENVSGIINDYVETIFSGVQKILKAGKKMMDMTEIPYHDYSDRMMPLFRHHYSERSKFFS
jgi:hypothetical protein